MRPVAPCAPAWKFAAAYLVVMFLCALAAFLAVGCAAPPAQTCRDAADGLLKRSSQIVLWCAP